MADGDPGDERGPEDEFDRALRELLDGIYSRPPIPEPSAAQRAAAARRAAALTAKATARATAAARPKAKRPEQRSGLGGVIAAWTVVVAVLAASGGITWFHFHSHANVLRSIKPVYHEVSGAHGPAISAPSAAVLINSAPFLGAGPPADPFAGTPADGWKDGAAGIAGPAPGRVGPFTAGQVRAAYQVTRKILIAGFLNWPTLRGGTPAAFANLLTSRQRGEFLAGLGKAGLDKRGFPLSTRAWVASFAPGTTTFVTQTVKVRGSMSAGTAVTSGVTVLRVAVSYQFVYAVEPPGAPGDWMRVVIQEYGHVDFASWDPGPLEPWVGMTPAAAGAQCGTTDGYIHPQYPDGPPPKVQPSGSPVDPYSAAAPASSGTYRCRNTTGT
jgi:hypothetical protein